MLERKLEILFIDYLLKRGYNKDNLLSQFAAGLDDISPRIHLDLIILDTINKEYIGIVEFKSRFDKQLEEVTKGQFYKTFGYLGTNDIPSYLVIPFEDDDFQIFEFTNNSFQPITKDDFPNFETLSAKRITDQKLKERQLLKKKAIAIENKKWKSKQSAYFSLLSLILGIVASITAIFFQQNGIGKSSNMTNFCCVSLNTKYQKLTNRMNTLESEINFHTKSISKIDTIYKNYNLTSLEKRIKILESGILSNPEKTLSLLQIRQEIEILKKTDDFAKELIQSKLEALKGEMEVQNSWMLGLLITIFGTTLSLVIPNLIPRKNESKI